MAIITKTPNDVRRDVLRTIRGGLIDLGVTTPNTDPGTDLYVEATAYANEISIAANNVVTLADQLMPDTAIEEALERILEIYGLSRRGASQASGKIDIVTTTTTFVAVGSQLVSNSGLVYEVTTGGNYSDGESIDVSSIDTGSNVNLAAGEVLTWSDTPAYTQTTAVVSQAITGGVDEEDDETARQRLLSRLQNPPALGNWQQVAELAESFDPVVQKAYIYPAANGPGTQHIALAGYATEVSRSREIASSKMVDLTAAITGQLPEFVDTVVTTVDDTNVDLTMALTLPYPEGNVNLGTGGGWKNFSPWPLAFDQSSLRSAYVAEAESSTRFTVTTLGVNQSEGSITGYAPTVDLTQISWIEKTSDGWKVRTAKVTLLDSDGENGNFVIEIDTPFVGVTGGDFIFPASENGQIYLDAILNHFAQMGPGEKVDVAGLIPRAKRKPRAGINFPATMDGQLLGKVTDSSNEVFSASYLLRELSSDQGVDIGINSPELPASVMDPPLIYVPNRIAWYPSEP